MYTKKKKMNQNFTIEKRVETDKNARPQKLQNIDHKSKLPFFPPRTKMNYEKTEFYTWARHEKVWSFK